MFATGLLTSLKKIAQARRPRIVEGGRVLTDGLLKTIGTARSNHVPDPALGQGRQTGLRQPPHRGGGARRGIKRRSPPFLPHHRDHHQQGNLRPRHFNRLTGPLNLAETEIGADTARRHC
ncbi:hypothetical protein NBRC116599_43400 [Aquicoccus sp. SU-CL01552]